MAQMYKVFINSGLLVFTDVANAAAHSYSHLNQVLGLKESLAQGAKKEVQVYCTDVEKAFADFCAAHQVIEAAGGLVYNLAGELLMIYRLGKWDLPKGKIEQGEVVAEAAVREVEEECGITAPKIVEALPNTYHTYRLKGQEIFKRTYWYKMKYQGPEKLKPQVEEDISEARWCKPAEVKTNLQNTYGNIALLLQEA
jgi:8-oxo-dGTP pyrophosphatase MutT (NUDIX family)